MQQLVTTFPDESTIILDVPSDIINKKATILESVNWFYLNVNSINLSNGSSYQTHNLF